MIGRNINIIRALLIGSIVGLPTSTSVLAEGMTAPNMSLEEYQAAIESFGVPSTQAKVTAQRAVDIIAEKQRRDGQLTNSAMDNNPLAGISDNFLEESPYAID